VTKTRKRAQQKPPPGIVWIDDYKDPETGDITPGIASRLGVTPSTFRKWRMADKGPKSFLLGKPVAAFIEDIDAWIAEQGGREHEAAVEARAEGRPPETRRTAKPLVPAA
jgi:transposase-like protein